MPFDIRDIQLLNFNIMNFNKYIDTIDNILNKYSSRQKFPPSKQIEKSSEPSKSSLLTPTFPTNSLLNKPEQFFAPSHLPKL